MDSTTTTTTKQEPQSSSSPPSQPQSTPKTSSPTTTTTTTTTTPTPRRRRIRSELDRLLSDEGTRNLLKNLKKKKPSSNNKGLVLKRNSKVTTKSSRVTTAAAATQPKVLNNNNKATPRVFRNGIRGRRINRGGGSSRGSGIVASSSSSPVQQQQQQKPSSSSSSRGGSPTKEQSNSVIDFKYVSVNRRDGVGFVTVLANSSSNNNRGGYSNCNVDGGDSVGANNNNNGSSSSSGNSNNNNSNSNSNNGNISNEKSSGSSSSSNTKGSGNNLLISCDGSWGVKVLQSIEAAFRTLEQDDSIKVLVLQSSHSRYFCNGIDLNELVIPLGQQHQSDHHHHQGKKSGSPGGGGNSSNNNSSNNSSSNSSNSGRFTPIIKAIKSLITTLNSTKKITVASISGDCVGIGVMILPLFDFVYANDKTMFSLNYNALGQSPEGIGIYQSLLLSGGGISSNGKLTNLFYLNTPLTATEALQSSIVTEILWPSRYQEELASRLTLLSSSRASLIIKTKATVRLYRNRNLNLKDLWGELGVVEGQWGSWGFQENLRRNFGGASSNYGVLSNNNGSSFNNGVSNKRES